MGITDPEPNMRSCTLAPGGKYFVVRAKDGYFHFYNTERQLKLGTHDRRTMHADEDVQCMDCAIVDDETALILAVLIRQKTSSRQ